jgi:hypothetical protein
MSQKTDDDSREARLAEALRENLKRRKAQARARATARKDGTPAAKNPYSQERVEPDKREP